MLPVLKGLLLGLLLGIPAMAQLTNVTAQVKDPNGSLYVNCQWSVVFNGLNTTPGAGPYSPSPLLGGQQGTCDSQGNFSISLADNVNTITPTPSQWSFSICSAQGYPAGPYCKTNISITITGTSQNISSTLQPLMPILPPFNGSAGNPGGSNNQLQINNNSAFGGLSNVAAGSVLASAGVSSLPVFQTKSIYDVRDFGVTGNGTTDDTTAFQSAINAACGSTLSLSAGAEVTIPRFFQVKVTSTINLNQCGGLVLDGQSATGQAGFGALIIWAGGNGGTVFSVNRTRDSIFRNFSINALNTSNEFNICFDIDENSGSGITSHNLYQNVLCGLSGGVQNSSFIGFRIGQNAPGNTEQQVFEDVVVACGGGTLTDTSNGKGFQINKSGGSAQPFYIPIIRAEILGCSHGIEVNANARDIIVDGGNYGSNFHSLYLNGGNGVTFQNITTTQDISSSIYLNGYSGQLWVKNNQFTGGGANVIDVTNASSGLKLNIENNDFGGVGMFTGTDTPGSYSGYLWIKGNNNFPSPCPTQLTASFGTILHNIPTSGNCDNMEIGTSGSATFGFYSRIDSLQNSPPVRFGGGYQNSATPTFATDYWQWQDVIGAGLNGTSTYTLTHSGTTGTLAADLTAASTTKLAAASVTGQVTSTVSTGTAPLVIASTTNIPNLNASLLLNNTWAAPGPIGGTTPSTIDGTAYNNHGTNGSVTISEPFGSKEIWSSIGCESSNGATTLSTSATTTVTGQLCLPAGSTIDFVTARVTTTITGACTGWELGDGTTAARFSSNNTGLTSGTTTDPAHIGTFNNTGINSATTGTWQATATAITITCAGGNPAAGAIRIIVYYHQLSQAPTS